MLSFIYFQSVERVIYLHIVKESIVSNLEVSRASGVGGNLVPEKLCLGILMWSTEESTASTVEYGATQI